MQDYGKSNISAVSGETKRILLFDKKVRLCRDPPHNVFRHFEEQSEPVGGKNKTLLMNVLCRTQLPVGIKLQLVCQLETIYWTKSKTFYTC